MFNSQTSNAQPSSVTVNFGDRVHQFRLAGGATVAELAVCIKELGRLHGGTPVSIQVALQSPITRLERRSHRYDRRAH
jgi:hypothetical protein